MGSFYVNYTVRCEDAKAVTAALAGRSAFVSPAVNGCCVVMEEESDRQDENRIVGLGAELSQRLSTVVLAVLNHDDDILWYGLFERGRQIDSYNSTPGYFDDAPDAELLGPEGGKAELLCAAFERGNVAEAERILRKSSFDDDGYVFALDRHRDLVAALTLPSFSIGASFRAAAAGECPEGFEVKQLLRA